MRIIEIRCPNCNSRLKCSDGIETYICPFCDSEFVLEGQSPKIVRAKVDLKIEEKRLENERHAMDLEHQRKMQEAANDASFSKWFPFVCLAIVAISLLILSLMPGGSLSLNNHIKATQKYIDAGDFSAARIEANKIRFPSFVLSFSERKVWNDTRKELLKQIDEAEKQAKKEAKEAEKEAKRQEKESDDSSFWSFLPWVA